MHQLRQALASRRAILTFRVLLGLVAIKLVIDSIKSVQVIQTYDVQFGTSFWFVNALIVVMALVGVLCILLMSRKWVWAVWVWAVSALGIALIGIFIGLNVSFLTQWQVILPWLILLASLLLRNRFSIPWKSGHLGRTIGGVAVFLVSLGVGASSIHQQVANERNAYLDPLKETIAEKNEQLPMMVNDELRLDRIAIELSVYNQYLTFPEYTVSELVSDPGLDYVRDFYAEAFMLQICGVPACQSNLAEGKSCKGAFQYNLVDMNGEQVVSFALDGSNCR